jgi:hypothetical protein
MPCCGNAHRANLEPAKLDAGLIALSPAHAGAAYLQYFGKTRLSVIGGVTRRLYRFDSPGAHAIADGRDVPSLLAIPTLRRI